MKFFCTAFEDGAEIPIKYTCDGSDVSPAVEWEDAPEGSKSYAITMHDPDAPGGNWDHWIIYDIPDVAFRLTDKIPPTAELPADMKQGVNSWDRIGYGGPCPPSGTHRYVFTFHALDVETLGLAPGASRAEVEKAVAKHSLASATYTGTYSRG